MLKVMLSVSMFVVFILAALEVRSWIRGTKAIAKPQKACRVTAALMIEAIIAMIMFAPATVGIHHPLFMLAYWAAALALSFGLVVVALIDMKISIKTFQNNRSQMLKQLIDEEISKNQR